MRFKFEILFLVALTLAGCGDEKDAQSSQTPASAPNEAPTISVKKADPAAVAANKAETWTSYDVEGRKRVNFGVGESNSTTKIIGANALVRSPLQNINKNLVRNKLSKNFLTKCSACHDDYANGIIGPSLLAKSEKEIFETIKAYKENEKVNILMKELVQKMKDEEIKELAGDISRMSEQIKEKK